MQKKNLIVLFALIVVSILIFFNNDFPPIRFVKNSVQNIMSVPKGFLYSLKIGKTDENQEISKLKEENRELTEKFVDFEKIKNDNEALRSQFELGTTKEYKLMPGEVIGFLGKFSLPTSLILDKGRIDGIKEGMAVILGKNLLGKISKVSENYSELTLIISNDFTSLAKTSQGNVPGVIIGAENFVLFERVSVNETVTQNDTLLTKGEIESQGYGIPPDLIIGKIASINRNESLPFQTAKIENSIQFSKLHTVFIVIGL